MKSTMLGAALLAIAGLIPATGAAQDAQTLKIATEPDYPPFEYRDTDGQLAGFDIDIGNEVCKRLARECAWVDQPFDSLIPGLQAHKFDLVNATMTATDARRKIIDFSTPMYIVQVKLMVRKGSGLQPTAQSLKGKRVGVQQGTTMETYARQEWAPQGVEIVSYPSHTNAFVAMASGRLDATFQEAQSAVDGFLNKPEGANFELVASPLDSPILNQPIAMGIRKGNPLKVEVDRALESMLADGTLQGYARKYFAEGNIAFPGAR
ncbi:transporter substrate-binding domain-containing protein [Castellaniella sp. GW247-6E4]|uniref:transporter substrate-binding domain-containing protein n=1 Tax=Castellaniella sp. GW247-6E4 TaxID=3140380 RepID=UPI0033148A87